ncbi:hypothetical protein JHL17_05770 [Azospirillum sp. YIM B02556]|uniref:Alpha-1,6-mannosyltransferase n=1 Tax=Azospirillum endophyticum TaxID=2800326 RepID=A0ABS1F0H0_9PROT|nr:hypothetical protein [Azospirillum endophyticum]MBK1836915.1 hypothetical protein [Azospirillum endophyticum]
MPNQAAFFDRLAASIADFSAPLAHALTAGNVFTHDGLYFLGYCLPLALPVAMAAWLFRRLSDFGGPITKAMTDRLFLWPVLFTAACLPSVPVMTQDIWFSALWGEEIVRGLNPYYVPFTPEQAAAFPFDEVPAMMTYGPLWAVVSAGLMALSGGTVWLTGLLFKLLLAGAWIGGLAIIRRIGRTHDEATAAAGLVAFGWLPIGHIYSAGEAHNDMAMVVFMLLWLMRLPAGDRAGPLALAASAACKYTSAALVVVDFLYRFRKSGRADRHPHLKGRIIAYVLRGVPAALFFLAVLFLFFRSPTFFDGVRGMSGWQWLQPADVVRVAERMTGMDLAPLRWLVRGAFAAFALWTLTMLYRRPTLENVWKAATAVMAAVVFGLSTHLWPWFMLWPLALAALVPSWWFSRWIFGVAALAPFAVVPFWRYEDGYDPFYTKTLMALPLYLGATVLMVWMLDRKDRAAVAAWTAALAGRLRIARPHRS